MNDPAIVWADEPTGDLDSEMADEIEGFELSRGRGGARCMSCPLERDAA